jgi:hypothetical protein
MTTTHKPFSLAVDMETTRLGEQVHAEPLEAHYAHRALLIREADARWLGLARAASDSAEAARFLALAPEDARRGLVAGRRAARLCQLRDRARRRYLRRLFGREAIGE